MFFHQAVFADDMEDENDTPAGAESVTAPARRTAYSITAADADWFFVRKGVCNELTVTMTPIGGANDVYSLEIYDPGLVMPVLISGKSGFGNARIDLAGAVNLDLVLVRVYGEDITDTSLYELKFEIADVNAPIRKDIDRLGRIRDRMNKRLVNLRKKNSTDRQINRLKRDIREVEVKIKKLKEKLCS